MFSLGYVEFIGTWNWVPLVPERLAVGTALPQKERSPQTGGHPENGAEHFQREPQGILPLRVQSKACKLQPGLRSFVCIQPRPFACLSLAAFPLQQPRGVVESGTIWLTKPKIFTLWPFTEKICQSRGIGSLFQDLYPRSHGLGILGRDIGLETSRYPAVSTALREHRRSISPRHLRFCPLPSPCHPHMKGRRGGLSLSLISSSGTGTALKNPS